MEKYTVEIDGISLTLGMSQSEVEKIIGEQGWELTELGNGHQLIFKNKQQGDLLGCCRFENGQLTSAGRVLKSFSHKEAFPFARTIFDVFRNGKEEGRSTAVISTYQVPEADVTRMSIQFEMGTKGISLDIIDRQNGVGDKEIRIFLQQIDYFPIIG